MNTAGDIAYCHHYTVSTVVGQRTRDNRHPSFNREPGTHSDGSACARPMINDLRRRRPIGMGARLAATSDGGWSTVKPVPQSASRQPNNTGCS